MEGRRLPPTPAPSITSHSASCCMCNTSTYCEHLRGSRDGAERTQELPAPGPPSLPQEDSPSENGAPPSLVQNSGTGDSLSFLEQRHGCQSLRNRNSLSSLASNDLGGPRGVRGLCGRIRSKGNRVCQMGLLTFPSMTLCVSPEQMDIGKVIIAMI